jgi:hypothetical protein
MGRSCFGFLVASQKQLNIIRDLEQKHNNDDEAGAQFEPTMEYVMKFKNLYYLILVNQGGRDRTQKWFEQHLPHNMVMYGSFEKPTGWNDCTDIFRAETVKQELDKLPTEFISLANVSDSFINAADFEALKYFERKHPEIYDYSDVSDNASTIDAFNILFSDRTYQEEFKMTIQSARNGTLEYSDDEIDQESDCDCEHCA